MKLNMKIGLATGLALLLLWVVTVTFRSSDHEEARVSASQPPHPLPKADTAPLFKDEGATPSQPKQQSDGATIKLKEYILSQHPAAIETRVDARDPFMGRYRLLGQRKVLLTSEEASELDAMLQDQEKRKLYQQYLQGIEVKAHAAADEQIYRLFLLQYLQASWIASRDPDILDFLIDFVLKDNFSQGLTLEIKKNLAYEKMKVLDFLQKHSPASLNIIQEKMPGLRHEKLLRDYLDKLPAT